jgi:hypothetical protein
MKGSHLDAFVLQKVHDAIALNASGKELIGTVAFSGLDRYPPTTDGHGVIEDLS